MEGKNELKNKKKDLGKGIRALLSGIDNLEVPVTGNTEDTGAIQKIMEVKVDSIDVNPFQPRNDFDQNAIQELSESIKIHGLIQPITVRMLPGGHFQLISGERRLRASKLAGLDAVPAFVRSANDQEMLEMALVENLQREDLNAIEIAISYQMLMEECKLTHEALSERVGKDRSTVTNYIRLLKLPPEIQQSIRSKQISMGHARALSGIGDIALQLMLFQQTVREGLSVRALENLIRKYAEPQKSVPSSAKATVSKEYKDIQDQLSRQFGTKIALKVDKAGKGNITIPFKDTDELNRLLEIFEE